MIRALVFSFLIIVGFSSNALADGAAAAAQVAQIAAVANIPENISDGNVHFGNCSSTNYMECIKGVASYAQAAATGLVVVSAGATKDQVSSGGGGGMGDFTVPQPDGGPDLSLNDLMYQAEEGLKNFEKLGYEYDKKKGTITGPGGKSAPASAMGSGQALADAGLINASDIEAYDASLEAKKKKRNKIIVKSMGSAKGGYKASSRRDTASVGGSAYSYGIDKSKISAAQTSGLTKDFGGTPIGVASDDLFNMLSQRYESLAEDQQFINNAAGSYPGQN